MKIKTEIIVKEDCTNPKAVGKIIKTWEDKNGNFKAKILINKKQLPNSKGVSCGYTYQENAKQELKKFFQKASFGENVVDEFLKERK